MKLAEYQARQIEHAIDIAVGTAKLELNNKELAARADLKPEQKFINQNTRLLFG